MTESLSLSAEQVAKLKEGDAPSKKKTSKKKAKSKKGSKAEREKASKASSSTGKKRKVLGVHSYLLGLKPSKSPVGVGAADTFDLRVNALKSLDVAEGKWSGDGVKSSSGSACIERIKMREIKGVAKTSSTGKKSLVSYGSKAAASRAKCDNAGFTVVPVKSPPSKGEIMTMYMVGYWYSKRLKSYITNHKGEGLPHHIDLKANTEGRGLVHAL